MKQETRRIWNIRIIILKPNKQVKWIYSSLFFSSCFVLKTLSHFSLFPYPQYGHCNKNVKTETLRHKNNVNLHSHLGIYRRFAGHYAGLGHWQLLKRRTGLPYWTLGWRFFATNPKTLTWWIFHSFASSGGGPLTAPGPGWTLSAQSLIAHCQDLT